VLARALSSSTSGDDVGVWVYDNIRVKSMHAERVGSLLIVAHGRESPSDEEWNGHLAYCVVEQHKFRSVLVTSLGGGPNAGQRRALLEAAGGHSFRTCICTDSVVARGVITAFNWLSPARMHALPYNQLDQALDVLDVPPAERREVKEVLARLQAKLSSEA
jgi:hypothetical protein